MRNTFIGLGLLGLVLGVARADENDLSAGLFICHHDPDMVYCVPPEGWCQHYLDDYAIEDTDQQNPSIMTTEERIWFLLTAFVDEKRWCGTEFGFGDYSSYLFLFTSWGPCAPGSVLEIPTEGWPGPNEGVAIVTTEGAWVGHLQPVYYFTGFVYAYYPGVIPVNVDPPTTFAGWGNCLTPPQSFDALCLPAMGIMTEGGECHLIPPVAVCCVGPDCSIITQEECNDLDGKWHPDETDCGPPNPCVPSAPERSGWGWIKATYR